MKEVENMDNVIHPKKVGVEDNIRSIDGKTKENLDTNKELNVKHEK